MPAEAPPAALHLALPVTPNQAYHLTILKQPGSLDVSVSLLAVPSSVPLETGTCVVHRQPLYDGAESCLDCWDDYEAYMSSSLD